MKTTNTAANISYHVPAIAQGQMVEYAYGSDSESFFYRRITDRSDRSVSYARIAMDSEAGFRISESAEWIETCHEETEWAALQEDDTVALKVERAIARSVSHNETVTLEADSAAERKALCSALWGECEDGVTANEGLEEFWGTTETGGEWRIHVPAAE